MSDQTALDPDEIPKFTGDQEQLDKDVSNIGTDATSLWEAGSRIDTTFNSLSAYYKAPDAEKLFATTRPVAAAGGELCDELETISSALAAYADEIRPLVKKFERLRKEATDFRAAIAHDDKWTEDGDKADENNRRRSEVDAAWAAFQAAERDCYARIVKLIGGGPLKVNDGSNKKGMYGYRAEDLDHAKGLPWGDPVDESTPWYRLDEHLWNFAKGIFVDGVWGAVRGLGTLVGVDGWDTAGQAWKGLSQLLTGLTLSAIAPAAYWAVPDDELPSWLRGSRRAVKETAKALVAWDEWGNNPSRAAGAFTFNILTTVFTGGAGTAAKTGGIAKAVSLAGKAGRIIDPMTYVAKTAGFGLTKVGDVMASLKAVTKGTYVELAGRTYEITDQPLAEGIPPGLRPETTLAMTYKGERVYYDLMNGTVHNADGTIRQTAEQARPELSAEERVAAARDASSVPERQIVGAHADAGGGRMGRVESNGGQRAFTGGTALGGDSLVDTGRTGESLPNGPTTGTAPPHIHAPDGLDHGEEDGLRNEPDAAARAATDVPGEHADVPRPSFMHDGSNPYGPHGALTPEQIKEIQAYRANHEPGYFDRYYKSNGRRLRTKITDESGFAPPHLIRDPMTSRWVPSTEAPPPIPERYVEGGHVSRGQDSALNHETLHVLDEAASRRRSSIDYSMSAERHKGNLATGHEVHGTPESELTQRDAANESRAAWSERTDAAENYGETVAEHQVIPEHYPGATKETLYGPLNGNDQFDQVWRRRDGGFAVVEAKSNVGTRLGSRQLPPPAGRAMQGSREYFLDILREMRGRGREYPSERKLAKELAKALEQGKVDYILVKGKADGARFAGYEMAKFDIG